MTVPPCPCDGSGRTGVTGRRHFAGIPIDDSETTDFHDFQWCRRSASWSSTRVPGRVPHNPTAASEAAGITLTDGERVDEEGGRNRLAPFRLSLIRGNHQMTTMKIAQIPKAGGEFQIIEREIPAPGPGQVRIRVQACGVCHSDVLVKDGGWPGLAYPRVPSAEEYLGGREPRGRASAHRARAPGDPAHPGGRACGVPAISGWQADSPDRRPRRVNILISRMSVARSVAVGIAIALASAVFVLAMVSHPPQHAAASCQGQIVIIHTPHGQPLECICSAGVLSPCFSPGP